MQQTAGGVVSALASDAGVDVASAEDGIDLPLYVADAGRSHHAHCLRLARWCGFDLYEDETGALAFGPYTRTSADHTFRYGADVLAAALEFTAVEAATTVVPESPASSQGDETAAWIVKDPSSHAGGDGPVLVSESALRTKEAADTAAQAGLARAARAALQGTVEVTGAPQVALGDAVALGEHARRRAQRHLPGARAETHPRRPPRLQDAAVAGGRAMIETFELLSAIQAIVREEIAARRFAELAVVTDVFPHADGGDKLNCECTVKLRDSGLELSHVPVATQRIGMAAIPNVDDLVLVTFVGGDLHAPIIVGRVYNDVDRAPVAKAGEHVYVSPDAAESGVRRFYLELPNSNTLTVDDDKAVLDMNGTKLTINNAGDVLIEAQGDINLKAQGKLALQAQGDVTVDGQAVTLKAQTSAQLEGQAGATVKGPMVTLAGNTSFSPC